MTPADRDNALRAARSNPGKGWREVVRDMATWDESHTTPAVELMKHDGMTAPQAIKQLEKDYATDRMRRVWREQVADSLAEHGLGTNEQLDEAYKVYVEALIAASRARVMRGLGVVKNPGVMQEDVTEAEVLYERFHRYPAKDIGEFAKGFEIPREVFLAGKAKYVTYRSGKVDPATLKKPRKPVNYIHDHDAGVDVYLTEFHASSLINAVDVELGQMTQVEVPEEFAEAQALCKLGESLGYAFFVEDELIEAEGVDPLPELYATPNGKCLLVIQNKREVIAMIWGGALGVFPRGIDG